MGFALKLPKRLNIYQNCLSETDLRIVSWCSIISSEVREPGYRVLLVTVGLKNQGTEKNTKSLLITDLGQTPGGNSEKNDGRYRCERDERDW